MPLGILLLAPALATSRPFFTVGGGVQLGQNLDPEPALGLAASATVGTTVGDLGVPKLWVDASALPLRLVSFDDAPAPALAPQGRVGVGCAWMVPVRGLFSELDRLREIGPQIELSRTWIRSSSTAGFDLYPVFEYGILLGSGEGGTGARRWQLGLSEEVGCNDRECVGLPAVRFTHRWPSGLLLDVEAGFVEAGVTVGYEWGWISHRP